MYHIKRYSYSTKSQIILFHVRDEDNTENSSGVMALNDEYPMDCKEEMVCVKKTSCTGRKNICKTVKKCCRNDVDGSRVSCGPTAIQNHRKLQNLQKLQKNQKHRNALGSQKTKASTLDRTVSVHESTSMPDTTLHIEIAEPPMTETKTWRPKRPLRRRLPPCFSDYGTRM
ncbi:hypothetical protein HHI36_001123 [Cryptolaemus montrouzieri]|uniref:WAP domain-containing protein n=1 Tax=Cryptolaemus montrouzieri TaxID=559131 RepID=A0ABD2P6G3_9CUCU